MDSIAFLIQKSAKNISVLQYKKHLNYFVLAKKKYFAIIFSLSVSTMNLKIQLRFKDQLLSQKSC